LTTASSRYGLDELRNLGQGARDVGGEARARGAVDDAVIVGERQRQHQPRHEAALAIYGTHRRARYAENRDLGRIDDRREGGTADAAETGDGETAPLHLAACELAGARGLRELGQS